MRTSLTQSEIQEKGLILSEYNLKGIESEERVLSDVLKFYPLATIEHIFELEENYHYQYSIIYLVKNADLHITIKFDKYRKKYFVGRQFPTFVNITHNTIQQAAQNLAARYLSEPNQMGVLSSKKIQDWIEYYTSIFEALQVENDKNKKKIEDFLDSIKDLPVTWYRGNKSGSLVKNGIEWSFTIEETYVSTSIKLHYTVDSSLETFLALSDNKL